MAKEAATMISMRMDNGLLARAKRLAESADRTFSAQVQRMLREWLDENDQPVTKPAKKAKS